MITQTSHNNKLYATWEVNRENNEVYLVVESSVYPLRFQLHTIPVTTGDQNRELLKKGIKELLLKINICCQCCDIEKVAEDVAEFITRKGSNYKTLRQWFSCKYQAVCE